LIVITVLFITVIEGEDQSQDNGEAKYNEEKYFGKKGPNGQIIKIKDQDEHRTYNEREEEISRKIGHFSHLCLSDFLLY
jgi:hypothetical protein